MTFEDEYPPYKVRIVVDANAGDHIQYVVHELLHVVCAPAWSFFDDTVEEICNVALDQYVTAYIKKRASRRARWDDLINKKLSAEREPVALEDQVKRPPSKEE